MSQNIQLSMDVQMLNHIKQKSSHGMITYLDSWTGRIFEAWLFIEDNPTNSEISKVHMILLIESPCSWHTRISSSYFQWVSNAPTNFEHEEWLRRLHIFSCHFKCIVYKVKR